MVRFFSTDCLVKFLVDGSRVGYGGGEMVHLDVASRFAQADVCRRIHS